MKTLIPTADQQCLIDAARYDATFQPTKTGVYSRDGCSIVKAFENVIRSFFVDNKENCVVETTTVRNNKADIVVRSIRVHRPKQDQYLHLRTPIQKLIQHEATVSSRAQEN